MLVGRNYEAAVQMIRAVPSRISLSPAARLIATVFLTGKWVTWLTGSESVGPQTVQIGVKCSDHWRILGANVRRGLSEYSGENSIDIAIVFFSNWFWNITNMANYQLLLIIVSRVINFSIFFGSDIQYFTNITWQKNYFNLTKHHWLSNSSRYKR